MAHFAVRSALTFEQGYSTEEACAVVGVKYNRFMQLSYHVNLRYNGRGDTKRWCREDVDKLARDRNRSLTKAPDGYYLIENIMALTGKTKSTLYARACTDKWRRRHVYSSVQTIAYHRDDVMSYIQNSRRKPK